jgi:serine/threonine protein phosphatase 1
VRRLFASSQKWPPKLPNGIRIYAVGDVHGRIDLLDRVLLQIDKDLAASPPFRAIQVFLGDYIDRGPASRAVLDRLAGRIRSGETVFLKGNHETFVARFLEDPALLSDWRQYGGLETLISYGLRPPLNPTRSEQLELAKVFKTALPPAHLDFLRRLRTSFSCGDFFFVHAGVRPGVPFSRQHEDDLLWIREDFLLHEEKFEKIVVHGHTPVREPEIKSNRINIDTGAYATGRLTCVRIEGSTAVVI